LINGGLAFNEVDIQRLAESALDGYFMSTGTTIYRMLDSSSVSFTGFMEIGLSSFAPVTI
jgi:hypothetical protein